MESLNSGTQGGIQIIFYFFITLGSPQTFSLRIIEFFSLFVKFLTDRSLFLFFLFDLIF